MMILIILQIIKVALKSEITLEDIDILKNCIFHLVIEILIVYLLKNNVISKDIIVGSSQILVVLFVVENHIWMHPDSYVYNEE